VPRPDWVVPVPLSVQRLRERGYNQAWELARRVAPALGLNARVDLVERLIDTPHQVGLDRQARGLNLHGAFAVTPAGRPALAGRAVALVDDVLTTGATAATLAAELQRAGVRDVQVWVVARTDRR
jgi:ComF family protein